MRQTLLASLLVAMASVCAVAADPGTVNLIANPDFQRTYAAQRQAAPDLLYGRADHKMLPKFEGKAALPYGWMLTPSKDGVGTVSWVDDAGKKTLRIRLEKGQSMRVTQAYVEVVPGGTYTLGLSIKGSGRVTLSVHAEQPAPGEWLTITAMDAAAQWKRIEAVKKVGPHRHVANYTIEVSGPADVMLREAEFSVQSASPAPADVQTTEPTKDDQTIFFEDFDGPKQSLQLNAGTRVTDKDGGRFGRGLATSAKDGGSITTLALGELPEKGTIEFWFKPSALPGPNGIATPLALTTQTPGMSQTQMEFDMSFWYASSCFGFRKGYTFDRAQAAGCAGWGRWQPDTWHHFAGSWDGDAMRVYVDGVLEGVCYGKERLHPRGKAVMLVLPTDGVIDEIRISKCLRYGPVVPVGVKPVLYSVMPAPAPAAAQAASDAKEETLDAQRAARISPVPPSAADFTFGIDTARPAWEGMTGFAIQKGFFGKGQDGLEIQRDWHVIGKAMYWHLEKIEAGEYFIGLWAETSNQHFRTELGVDKLLVSAYLNGWPVRFATTSDPIQVRPGVWLAELQSASPVKLKEGDEIAFWPDSRAQKQNFLRLALYRKQPAAGRGVTGQTFGVDGGNPQRLRLVVSSEIKGSGEDGAKHEARIEIANPLPYAVDTQVTWKLADYYGAPVVEKSESLHIDAHKTVVISHPFTASGDAHAYQLDVKTRPAQGFKFPVPRPAEMLPLSDYSRMEFLPALPDPLTVWDHARRDLADDRTGDRKLLCLDGGDWEAALMEGRHAPKVIPDKLAYQPFAVPFPHIFIKLPKDCFGRWYRKAFIAPQWLQGQRYVIEFNNLSGDATVFLNNQLVGYGAGTLPVSVDVTKALKPGARNELAICVRGGIALVSPEFVDKYDPENARVICENQDIEGRATMNSACLGSVYLRVLPEVRVKQSLVVPDVEKGTLRILTRVHNASDRAREVTLRFEVQQNGKPVEVAIPLRKVALKAGETVETSVDAPAGKLVPWVPRDPVLAKMVTHVEVGSAVVDSFDRRFGYRSMKVKGTNLMFNGKPAKYFGGFQRSTRDIYEAENGVDSSRSGSCDGVDSWDLFDEIGYHCLNYVGYDSGAQGWGRLKNAKFWDSWRHTAMEIMWNLGSHPCIVGVDLSCESYCYAPYSAGKEGQEKHGELIFSAAQEIRKKIWPDYWFVADGDHTLGGRLEFCSFHYMNHYYAMGGFSQNPAGGFGYLDGVSMYQPDGFFLNGAATVPRPGTVLALRPNWIYGSTACGDTETFEFWGLHNGVPLSKYIGDRAAVSSAYQFYDPRGMAWTKSAIEGARDMEQALFSGMYWKSFLGLAAQDVAFIVPQQEVRYYSGAKFDRRLNIHDDDYLPGKLLFQWKLLTAGGSVVKEGKFEADSDTAFLKRDRIAFDLPQVKERTPYRLTMELSKDGKRRHAEDRTIEVWPALSAVPKTAITDPVMVYDPKKTLLPCLDKLGCEIKPVVSLDAASLAGSKHLIIGPDCVTPDMADRRDILRDFVRAGGRVLILHQNDSALLPVDVVIEKRAWFSVGWVRSQAHPVTKGLRDVDFQMWNPGHLVVQGAFRKPDTGAVLALVDSGQDNTMSWAEMLEIYLGKGSVVATQLPLTEKFHTEPMCAEMLRRLVDYFAQPVFRTTGQPLAVLDGASEPVVKRLTEARASFEVLSAPNPAKPVTLVDLGVDRKPPDVATVRAYAQNGGTLLLHRIRPEHQAWLTDLIGRKASVEVQPYQGWVDKQMLQRRDGLTEGLTNLDLYWRTQHIHEDQAAHWQVSNGVELGKERGQVQYVVKVEGAADYLFPGGLVEVSLGKGRVVIDQVKWEMPATDMICGSPMRCLSVLLTNLGVDRKLPAPKPSLPKGVTYETIDISSQANRSFNDDKAGDEIGWVDWGSDANMSPFKTGKVHLAGVPYDVPSGDKNAIVLRVTPEYVKSLAKYPDSVTIPVDKRRVAGLLFLHTGGWMAGVTPFGERRIEYTDGTKEVIYLNCTNMADWNPGKDNFADEEGTLTTVAWSGANNMYPVIRVYQTLWVNPHPDKTIKQVVIGNAGLEEKQWRFIAHLGVTAAILPAAAHQAQRDPDKSKALLREGMSLQDKKQFKEAAAKLEQAVRFDDQNSDAWTLLAGLRAQTDSVEAFTELCQRWATAMPKNFGAHNVLGKFLEGKGKLREAIAEYKKSVEIDANQPPIHQDIARLEKKLQEK